MSTLNIDIITVEILPKLPLKSLIRFKTVSKSFNTIISSRHFTNLYHHHLSITNPNNLLVLPEKHRLFCHLLNNNPSPFSITTTFEWDPKGSLSVVGSTNGLLCLFTCGIVNYFSILNPTTRLYKFTRTSFKGGPSHGFGFGFDHRKLDFKIVTLYKTRITMVYSVNNNSWKDIVSPVDLKEEIAINECGAVINNHLLHWMFKNSVSKHRIGCFDIFTMKWADDVLLPRFYYSDFDSDYIKITSFGVLDDCLFISLENQVESRFNVWVMKEYRVQDSWIELLSVDFTSGLRGLIPIASRADFDDEILIRQHGSSRLVWYNRISGGSKEAEFPGDPDFSGREACMCSSSLVDFPGGKLFERA